MAQMMFRGVEGRISAMIRAALPPHMGALEGFMDDGHPAITVACRAYPGPSFRLRLAFHPDVPPEDPEAAVVEIVQALLDRWLYEVEPQGEA